ncbi:MAG: lysophospholipid acyltransferase family protein, partial [Pseudomonadota bacterium]
GASVLIFPEGTRSPDGRLQPFRPGGFHLALRSGCDIMPVVIVGSRRIVPKGSLRIEKGSFVMCIGEAIPTKDYTRKDMDQLMSRVREAMEKETRMYEP